MSLFELGSVVLRSGEESRFKIECDALTQQDIDCIAYLISRRVPRFGSVDGVPRGGIKLAAAMGEYCYKWSDRLLIVEDVCTTGVSMENYRAGRDAIGACIFLRGKCPDWVTPLLIMTPELDGRGL